jgi:hypothetical protein
LLELGRRSPLGHLATQFHVFTPKLPGQKIKVEKENVVRAVTFVVANFALGLGGKEHHFKE